jgi:hypothetical protein
MLRSKEFWTGVVIAYLLVIFFPALNFRNHMGGGSPK